jgi:hypothetical protein
MRIINYVQVFFVHKRIISAVKRVEFVSDRMSYTILRGRWCHIIVLNVHAPTRNNANVGRKDIFKPTIGNESSHEWIMELD